MLPGLVSAEKSEPERALKQLIGEYCSLHVKYIERIVRFWILLLCLSLL